MPNDATATVLRLATRSNEDVEWGAPFVSVEPVTQAIHADIIIPVPCDAAWCVTIRRPDGSLMGLGNRFATAAEGVADLHQYAGQLANRRGYSGLLHRGRVRAA